MFDDDEVDFPPVTPGTAVYIQLRSNSYWSNGIKKFTKPDRPVRMIVHDRDNCWPDLVQGDSPDLVAAQDAGPDFAHQSTVCPECIDTWAIDYYVSLGDTPHDLGLREKA